VGLVDLDLFARSEAGSLEEASRFVLIVLSTEVLFACVETGSLEEAVVFVFV
jgi:hypothetical protein